MERPVDRITHRYSSLPWQREETRGRSDLPVQIPRNRRPSSLKRVNIALVLNG
ncbi:Polysaccharide export protein [Altererythrobacter epoxidivorans]|uniref:Polysaccharide export protein n=1 Tax=Altererythrobacter epoxidivorans TaxID=361183 RepID=A0A0M4MGQ6_9SPHN|nr:Polysaccharide export protein [Altererythrobacter epoxidivorans]